MSQNFIYSNFANTTLAAPITTTSQTTLTLSSTTNAPAISAGQLWVIVLNDAATQGVYEIVYGTARAGAVVTITRGQEGTAATTWLANDLVYAPDTAAILNNMALVNGSSSQNFAAAALSLTGAITGATSGTFSTFLSANTMTAASTIFADNSSGGTGQGIHAGNGATAMLIQSHSASNVTSIFDALNHSTSSAQNAFAWTRNNLVTTLMAITDAGNLTLVGSINAGGTVQATLSGVGSYVPPAYTAAGVALTASTHIVQGSVSVTTGSSATVTLSGPAAFTSAATYAVVLCGEASVGLGGTANGITVGGKAAGSFTIYNNSANTATIDYIALGS